VAAAEQTPAGTPSVESVAGDRTHGSAWISLRAVEVLRDRAAVLARRQEDGRVEPALAVAELRRLAVDLLEARPTMAALANRVHRAMAAATAATAAAGEGGIPFAAALEAAARREIGRASAADAAAAAVAAELAAGRTVLTLSRSGTVSAALLAADPPPRVWVAESGPQREGVEVARRLSAAGLEVTLCADAAIAAATAGELAGGPNLDLVLVGADTLLPEGTVVNKVGTAAAALAARRVDVPFYAVAATDKVDPDGSFRSEDGDPDDLLRVQPGESGPARWVPLFEPVLADLVTGVVTERGVLGPDELAGVAVELAALRAWLET
jgi:translation initiation factor 2B subunit (eIF-2B alpha/beta/delta family)